MNEEAITRVGPQRQKKRNLVQIQASFRNKIEWPIFLQMPNDTYIAKEEHVQMNWIILLIITRVIRNKFMTVNKVIFSPLYCVGFNMCNQV
jgi:hypothetical protein